MEKVDGDEIPDKRSRVKTTQTAGTPAKKAKSAGGRGRGKAGKAGKAVKKHKCSGPSWVHLQHLIFFHKIPQGPVIQEHVNFKRDKKLIKIRFNLEILIT